MSSPDTITSAQRDWQRICPKEVPIPHRNESYRQVVSAAASGNG
jgi:hypothetical protein